MVDEPFVRRLRFDLPRASFSRHNLLLVYIISSHDLHRRPWRNWWSSRWLLHAITVENVAVRREGNVLFLPAGPAFVLDKEIKNMVTVVAKTHHYWTEHAAEPILALCVVYCGIIALWAVLALAGGAVVFYLVQPQPTLATGVFGDGAWHLLNRL